MAKTKFLSEKNEVDIELALVTMALLPDDEEAAVQLKEQHGITTTATRLAVVRRRFAEQFQKAREGVAVQQENALISDLRDNAKLAGVAIQLAVKPPACPPDGSPGASVKEREPPDGGERPDGRGRVQAPAQ
jgi:hypothetical protein